MLLEIRKDAESHRICFLEHSPLEVTIEVSLQIKLKEPQLFLWFLCGSLKGLLKKIESMRSSD
jgi:hypothetical protein